MFCLRIMPCWFKMKMNIFFFAKVTREFYYYMLFLLLILAYDIMYLQYSPCQVSARLPLYKEFSTLEVIQR